MVVSTCGELADYLVSQPRDRKIVMSSDAEGNSYSPLEDAYEVMYSADTTWSGEVKPTPEDLAKLVAHGGWSEEDRAPEDAERVVVLHPVN